MSDQLDLGMLPGMRVLRILIKQPSTSEDPFPELTSHPTYFHLMEPLNLLLAENRMVLRNDLVPARAERSWKCPGIIIWSKIVDPKELQHHKPEFMFFEPQPWRLADGLSRPQGGARQVGNPVLQSHRRTSEIITEQNSR